MRKLTLTVLFLGGPYFLTGCATLKKGRVDVRGGLTAISYDLDIGQRLQTTPVHPDDASFLSGNTTTNLTGGWQPFSTEVGFAALWGDKIRFETGLMTRISYPEEEWRKGIFDTRQQVSDMRPSANGSHVYTLFKPGRLTVTPFIGVRASLSRAVRVMLEAGLPWTDFEVESGHDRYGNWQRVQKDSWSGLGRNASLSFNFGKGENAYYVGVMREDFPAEFAGEDSPISSFGVFGGWVLRLEED